MESLKNPNCTSHNQKLINQPLFNNLIDFYILNFNKIILKNTLKSYVYFLTNSGAKYNGVPAASFNYF